MNNIKVILLFTS